MCVYVCMCVCVSVCTRAAKRQTEKSKLEMSFVPSVPGKQTSFDIFFSFFRGSDVPLQ